MKTLRIRVASLAAALAACLSTQAVAQTAWTEIRGDHFILRGGFDADRLRPIACEVQQVLRLLSLPPDADPIPSVVAAANEAELRALLPQFWERHGARPVGGYWAGLYGHHVAVQVDAGREERLRRLLHEFAHFATRLRHKNPPRWLDEGLSEVWASIAVENARIEVGRPVARHLRMLRSGRNWIQVADLLEITAIPQEGSRASMFYAESWALVHYLLFDKARGPLVLDRLPGPGDLPTDDELQNYARARLAAPVRISTPPAPDCDDALRSRRLSEAESLVLRAQALADGERPDAALPLLAEVLRRDAGNAAAMETLGFVHFTGNKHREAAAAFDEVIATGRASHIAYFYRAVLASPLPDLTDGSGPVPEIEYLRRAVRLNPGFQPAVARLREALGKLPVAPQRPAVPQ